MAKDGQITIDLSRIVANLRKKNADNPEALRHLDAFENRERTTHDAEVADLVRTLRLVKPEDTE